MDDSENMKENEDFFIKENSWIAKVASWKLRSKKMAIVIGKTIHLHMISREDFLVNSRWLKHELCHVAQFKAHGKFSFIFKYIMESVSKGYFNNKYEMEARAAEKIV